MCKCQTIFIKGRDRKDREDMIHDFRWEGTFLQPFVILIFVWKLKQRQYVKGSTSRPFTYSLYCSDISNITEVFTVLFTVDTIIGIGALYWNFSQTIMNFFFWNPLFWLVIFLVYFLGCHSLMAGLRIPFQFFEKKGIYPCFWSLSPLFFHLHHF